MTAKLSEVNNQIEAWDKECVKLLEELEELEQRKEEITSRIEALQEMMNVCEEKFFKGDD